MKHQPKNKEEYTVKNVYGMRGSTHTSLRAALIQKFPEMDYDDFLLIQRLSRLARRHDALAVMDCNGYGVINGQAYYNGSIDDYARRTYGQGVRSAYIKDEDTVFDIESDKIKDKAKKLIKGKGKFRLEFQGDPRGYTMKVFYKDTILNSILG